VQQPDWRRYVAPAAFLLAVTIAIVLIRAGLNAGGSTAPTGATVTSRHGTTVAARKRPTKRYWIVHAGDTFAVISSQTGVSVAKIARLNPKLSSTSLHIGQKVRIR
jgi:LysM repeat protein